MKVVSKQTAPECKLFKHKELRIEMGDTCRHLDRKDVERVVHRAPQNAAKTIYDIQDLHPGRSLVYVEECKRCYVGRIRTINLPPDGPTDKGHIEIEIPNSEPVTIEGHLERIPYGFDRPIKYELVISSDVRTFELLGDYDTLRRRIRRESAIARGVLMFEDEAPEMEAKACPA